MMAWAVVFYKAKWIPIVSISSVEAEFTTAPSAAKTAKWLRSTVLFEDNANAKNPTERSRHVDIQHFILQELGSDKEV